MDEIPKSTSGVEVSAPSIPTLEARDVYKFYPSGERTIAVLREVSLSVGSGTFVAIMGPSGSGKSTLLHILSGLEEPSAGSVSIEGRPLGGLSDRERTLLRRERIGFVFQFFNLIPHLTVAENILLPRWIAREDPVEHPEGFYELLDRFRLQGCADRHPHQISGGEMQRTSIARALVRKPAILMADEPTGNISSRAGVEVLELLRSSCDEFQQTILLVTHNPRDAAYADEVHFLKDGMISPDVHLSGTEVDEARVLDCLKELDI